MTRPFKTMKYFTVAIISSVVLFIILSTFIIVNVISQLNTKTDALVYDSTFQKSNYVNKLIGNDITTIANIAACCSDYKTTDRTALKAKLKSLSETGKFLNIIIIDENGDVISYRNENINVADREYFKKSIDGDTYLSSTIYSNPDSKMVTVISAPIYGDYKRVVGVVAGILPSDIYSYELDMAMNGKEKDANGYIIDSSGEVILYGTGSIKDFKPVDSLFFTSPFMSGVSEESKREVQNNFSKKNTPGIVKSDCDGTEYIAYYTDLEIDSELHYVVIFPASAVFSNLYGYVDKIILMFILYLAIILIIVIAYFVAARTSIHKLKTANDEISRIAYVDSLTGYSTWNKFDIDAQRLIQHEYRKYVFVSFDIDKFKAINDMFGHDEGNRILKLIADTLSRNLREGETFSRINSDNFYALMIYKDDHEIISRIQAFIQALEYEITEFVPVLSFGIYRITDKKLSVRKMGDLADIAKRTIKYGDHSAFTFYSESMLEEMREEKRIENEMQSALDTHEFCVFFQPKVSLSGSPVLTGAEALVRWIKNDTVISPGKFIPLFEKNRFIVKLDYYIMDQVCQKIKQWQRQGYGDILVSVNMSRVHLNDPTFTDRLYEICCMHDVPTSNIEIEITESAAYEALDVLEKVFKKLKEYGFHISIDDFGSGYSSLNMLKDLPADVLKIDRAFLTESGNNKRANDIIAHVIKMARSLGMETICEGIETDEQVNLLRSLGCDMAQGYYFAKPMSSTAFEEILKKHNSPLNPNKE